MDLDSNGGFLSDVPLAGVKRARFMSKLGAFHTLARLILNGAAYSFTGVSGGAVIMSADAADWKFIAPDGRFDAEALAAMTGGEFLEAWAAECEAAPVAAWDDFAAWLGTAGITEQVGLIFSQCVRAAVAGIDVPVPTFRAPEGFAGLLRWVRSTAGSAAGLPAARFRDGAAPNRFVLPLKLYAPGETAEEQVIGYRLTTPAEDAGADVRPVLISGEKGIYYSDRDGALTRPCLMVTPSLCPTFAVNYAPFDGIIYAYGTTSDTLGYGRTISAGWYAVRSSDFLAEPFDLAGNPIKLCPEDLEQAEYVDPYFFQAAEAVTGVPDRLQMTVSYSFQV